METVGVESRWAKTVGAVIMEAFELLPNVRVVPISGGPPENGSESERVNWAVARAASYGVDHVLLCSVGQLGRQHILNIENVSAALGGVDGKSTRVSDGSMGDLFEDMDLVWKHLFVDRLRTPEGKSLGFDQEELAKAIHIGREELEFCYETYGRGVAGEIVVGWTILPSGKPRDVSVVSDDLEIAALNTCLVDGVRSWFFPSGTASLEVKHPFVFSTSR